MGGSAFTVSHSPFPVFKTWLLLVLKSAPNRKPKIKDPAEGKSCLMTGTGTENRKPFTPPNKKLSPRFAPGFSLIEVVVAMGILTFALVGLLALFPVALQTAAESKSETRITQIAQSVFADLRASPLSANVLIVGNDIQQSGNRQTVNFSTAQTHYIGYNADGTCVGALTVDNYNNGISGKGEFILKLSSVPVTPSTIPALSTITLSVESPSTAPEANRQKVIFVTMKGDL